MMSKHLQRDLENTERELLALSSRVEEMIRTAVRALCERRPALAKQVISQDSEIDEREVRLEEECLKILALHQPVARDLRRTATVMKVTNDLERIADLAVNIAERSLSVASYPEFPIPETLVRMVEGATAMVRDALDSLVALDADQARDVCIRDEEIDSLNRDLINELYETMRAEPAALETGMHLFSAARHVERIADHATNIAEDVIYLVEGEIARHKYDHVELSQKAR